MTPDKPCRCRRHFSPQTRMNRFVFLNLPILSLGAHLGLTTSPHVPFPTGYVTLSMCDRSPPFGLTLPRSRKRAIYRKAVDMHSEHAQVSSGPLQAPTRAGRTVRDVTDVRGIGLIDVKLPIQHIRGNRLTMAGVRRDFIRTTGFDLESLVLH